MALSNRDRIDRALEQLQAGLRPYVEQEMRATWEDAWLDKYVPPHVNPLDAKFDCQAMLSSMIYTWDECFSYCLEPDQKQLLYDARNVRNRHAHGESFNFDEAVAGLIAVQRLLEVIKAPQAEEVEKLKVDLMKVHLEGSSQKEKKKASTAPIEGSVIGHLKSWREVVAPHQDVQKGTYQQAEFAADIWQVYQGKASPEYQIPTEFFGRTFITDGLSELLVNALKRLSGAGGDPTVELQINFGGGKTHSMIALYHLFSGVNAIDLPGVDDVLKKAEIKQPPTVRRAVLAGTEMRPGMPLKKDDGTVVNTLWGEMAWQLGGGEAFEVIRQADETATNPGSALDELFAHCGPCLILIDEWVAYARQLFKRQHMLPAGDFDTQFTFAQALTQAARRAKDVLLLVSIPSSITEQGDEGGQAALDSLKHAVGRQNLVWRPATSDESFEIVRRRLFQPLAPDKRDDRDEVVSAFCSLYRANPQEFPSECRDAEYERRMKSAYPIHPELFDRLYQDWSTLERFQRTRGVLRLMAAVIHDLWESGDASRLILPAMVPVVDPAVQPEMVRYLDERWSPIIDKDVDGPNSAPLHLDLENDHYGKYSACRRVARTVFIGSAPTQKAATVGIEDRRVKLGCVQPGESPAQFGDALRKLSSEKTAYLYVNGNRYWYSTQPSVNSLAKERAERDFTADDVNLEIVRRLSERHRQRGDFSAVYVAPDSHEIGEEREVRLIILGPTHHHKTGQSDSPAVAEALNLLVNRGASQRLNRNTLVFLAPDLQRLPDLIHGVRMQLAWKSIVEEADGTLDLTHYNKQQATTKLDEADRTIEQRIGEAYQWVLAPKQPAKNAGPGVVADWDLLRAQSADPLAVRVAKKLKNEDAMIYQYGGNMLAMELGKVPLWNGDNITVRQLEDYFAQYLYLPRLRDMKVLHEAIRDGVRAMNWAEECFAYADGLNETTGKYVGLKAGEVLDSSKQLMGLLVKPDVALPLLESEEARGVTYGKGGGKTDQPGEVAEPTGASAVSVAAKKLTKFHGQITLDANQLSTSAKKISDEVLRHLVSALGSDAEVRLDIEVRNDTGFNEAVVRTVKENCSTLKFDHTAFEEN